MLTSPNLLPALVEVGEVQEVLVEVEVVEVMEVLVEVMEVLVDVVEVMEVLVEGVEAVEVDRRALLPSQPHLNRTAHLEESWAVFPTIPIHS